MIFIFERWYWRLVHLFRTGGYKCIKKYRWFVDIIGNKINKYSVFSMIVIVIAGLLIANKLMSKQQFIDLLLLIAPIITLCSLFIVYLSIEVMNEGNRFAKGMLIFNRFKVEIESERDRRNKPMFDNEFWNDEVQTVLNVDLRRISIQNFPYVFNSAASTLIGHMDYKIYMNMAKEEGVLTNKIEIEHVNRVSNALLYIQRVIEEYTRYQRILTNKYISILGSNQLVNEQVIELYHSLDIMTLGYRRLCKRIQEKDESIKELLALRTLICTISSGKLMVGNHFFDDKFLKPYLNYEMIATVCRIDRKIEYSFH